MSSGTSFLSTLSRSIRTFTGKRRNSFRLLCCRRGSFHRIIRYSMLVSLCTCINLCLHECTYYRPGQSLRIPCSRDLQWPFLVQHQQASTLTARTTVISSFKALPKERTLERSSAPTKSTGSDNFKGTFGSCQNRRKKLDEEQRVSRDQMHETDLQSAPVKQRSIPWGNRKDGTSYIQRNLYSCSPLGNKTQSRWKST